MQTMLMTSLTPRTTVAPVDEDDEPEAEPDDYDAAVREVAGEEVGPRRGGSAAGAATTPAKKRGAQPAPHVPTPSEKAVHVREDVSKVFVIAAVAVFVAILLNAPAVRQRRAASHPRDRQSECVCRAVRERVGRSSASPSAVGACVGIGQPGPVGFGVGTRVRRRRRRHRRSLRRALGLAQPVGRPPGPILPACARTRAPTSPAIERGWSTSSSAPAGSTTSACSRRWPRSRASGSSASAIGAARTPTRPCRSMPARRSASRGSSRA